MIYCLFHPVYIVLISWKSYIFVHLVDEPAPKLTDTPALAMANLCSGRLYVKFNYLLDNFEAAYCGEWESEEDFSGHIVEESYNLVLKIAEYLLNKLK